MTNIDVSFGAAVRETDGLYRVACAGRRVLEIPKTDHNMQKRLLVWAHMQEAGHRGVDITLARLRVYCVGRGMDHDVRTLVGKCL